MPPTTRAMHALAGAACLALALPGLARADVFTTGYLYVSDYGTSQLDRFKYTYDQTSNVITDISAYGYGGNTSNAYFLGGGLNPVKEGVHGTASDLILVGGSHGSGVTNITRYTLDGTLIGTIPINFSSYNGGNVGIGNVLVTSDGKYMYAPLETAGYIVKVDLATGKIVASVAFTGAHDVAIAANGNVYASNYNATGAKVIALDANLNKLQDLITTGPGTSFRPSGLSVAADGSLYVNNNLRGGPDSVLHYTLTGTSGAQTATLDIPGSYIGSSTPSQAMLEFTFGSNIGPDGNVYIAALGGGGSGNFSVTPGYVDGVYKLNLSTDAMSLAIPGATEPTGGLGPVGLSAPKYLQFSTNFVTAQDAGYRIAEPAGLPVLAVGLGMLGLARRRKGRIFFL